MAATFKYKDSGVDQDAADHFSESILEHMRRTYGPQVVNNPLGYAGLFAIDGQAWLLGQRYRNPVMVASTDGVGTKLKIAFMMDKHDTVGLDLVAMCVNDVLCEGAKPMFFLDYIATGKLEESQLLAVLKGIADGCEQAHCALLGGETAQMPGFYAPGEYDLVGFTVGMVEKARMMKRSHVKPGQVAIGVASSGLHSNGYSLARTVLFEKAGYTVDSHIHELGCKLGEELLKPTHIYVNAIQKLRTIYEVKHIPSGIAHITGGGLPGNIPRVLPEKCDVVLKEGSWPVHPIFDIIRKEADLDDAEMYDVFNMGLGMILLASEYYAEAAIRRLKDEGHDAYIVGEVCEGSQQVRFTS